MCVLATNNTMLQSVKEIINSSVNTYRGSEATRSMIEDQIREKYGESELKNYDPHYSARTFHSWLKLGFKVRKGEKALKSITFIETKDANGNILKKIKRPCFIFYYRQVELITPSETV